MAATCLPPSRKSAHKEALCTFTVQPIYFKFLCKLADSDNNIRIFTEAHRRINEVPTVLRETKGKVHLLEA